LPIKLQWLLTRATRLPNPNCPHHPKLSPPPALSTPLRTGAEVRAALDRSNWNAAKLLLLNKPEFDWLSAFEGDVSVDSIVYDVTSKLLHVEPPYDRYQIETLVSSARLKSWYSKARRTACSSRSYISRRYVRHRSNDELERRCRFDIQLSVISIAWCRALP
jgi:hypothetical protein